MFFSRGLNLMLCLVPRKLLKRGKKMIKKKNTLGDEKKNIFFVIKNKKQGVLKKHILVAFTCFMRTVLINNYSNVEDDLK